VYGISRVKALSGILFESGLTFDRFKFVDPINSRDSSRDFKFIVL